MIELSRFVPEIKIHPKVREYNVGDEFYINCGFGSRDEHWIKYKIIGTFKGDRNDIFYNIKELINGLEYTVPLDIINKRFKEGNYKWKLNEIKIYPNDGKPRNNKELEQFLIRNLSEFITRINLKLKISRYYSAMVVPKDLNRNDIELDQAYHYDYENGQEGKETIDIALVWVTALSEQSGNLFLSIFEDDLDHIGFIELKGVKIYYDIITL